MARTWPAGERPSRRFVLTAFVFALMLAVPVVPGTPPSVVAAPMAIAPSGEQPPSADSWGELSDPPRPDGEPANTNARADSQVAEVARVDEERGSVASLAQARSLGFDVAKGRLRVIAEASNVAAAKLGATKAGALVEASAGDLVQLRATPGQLKHLFAVTAISYVRSPLIYQEDAILGQGVATTSANTWHAAGLRGTGVKVAVIDTGFSGLAEAQASGDLPATLTTKDYCDGKFLTKSPHGTAVAEIVHEMAPDAQLYLICMGTGVQLAQAEAYAKANGISVVNHSVSWFNSSRGDGSGGPGTPDATAADARASGILWVNASGNQARAHWSGSFIDRGDGSGWNLFAPGGVWGTGFIIDSGETVCALLKWDDWPTSSQNYDLSIVNASGTILDTGDGLQNGSQPPTERACYTNPGAKAAFYAAIKRTSANATPRFDLFVPEAGVIQYPVALGSVTEPGSSPATLSVGAVCWAATTIEPFSSQGPTIDSRTKPDISGPDQVSSHTYGAFTDCSEGHGFLGTSAASPHVAGAAALVKSANPSMTVDSLQAYLETNAQDLGVPGDDSVFGSGMLRLPAPTPPSNTAPTISNIPNQTTPVNTPEGPLAFTIGDAETAPGSLGVTGSSSNTTLVPNANITFGGSGASRTVTVTPATGQVGTTTITVTVSDGDLTAQDTFVQTVTSTSTECPPDDAFEPNNSRGTAAPLANGQAVAGIACDDDYFSIAAVAGQTITADLTFIHADGDLDMPLLDAAGTLVDISASVTDNEHLDYDVTQTGTHYVWAYPYNGAANQNSYGLTVTVTGASSNTAPTISNIPNQTTPVNTPEGPLAFTIGDAETAPGSLGVTGSSSNTTLVPNANITFGGSGASRTVTVTPATGQVGTTTITVTVSDGDLTAQDTFVQTVTSSDTGITASGVGVSYATFYPYKDGYRDKVAIRGTPGEPLSATVKVYNSSGKKVRSWTLGTRSTPWSISWNGKTASGTRLPAGTYKVTQTLRDAFGHTKTYTAYTKISNKRLSWSTATITKYGNQYSMAGDPGSGSVSKSKSSYSRGVRLTSGTSWVAVGYSFTLRAAKIYEPLRLKVLGRSPNGGMGEEGLWNRTYGASNDVGSYDRKTIGPGYRWYTIKGASSTHRSGRSTHGMVYVEYAGGTQKFDVSKVRLTYRYAVLR